MLTVGDKVILWGDFFSDHVCAEIIASEKLCSATLTKLENHASTPEKTLCSVLAGAWYYFMFDGNSKIELKRSQVNPSQCN